MSHIVKMEASYKLLADIIAAGLRMGWSFDAAARAYRWFGQFVGDWKLPKGMKVEEIGKATHGVFTVPGAGYQVGVVQESDGTFSLRADWYSSGGLLRATRVSSPEEFAGRFKQAYGVESTIRACRTAGKQVSETFDAATGDVKLTVKSGGSFGGDFGGGF